jgi:hydroxylaminobenzene mutase
MTSMEDTQRRLIWHGTFLFLLGLITGFAESSFANVRMGLAAHLEGLMNGIFLVALGSAWAKIRLFYLRPRQLLFGWRYMAPT